MSHSEGPEGGGRQERRYQRRGVKASQKISPKAIFEEKFFELRLNDRGYPASVVKKHLPEVKFLDRKSALKQKTKLHVRKINTTLCYAIPPGMAQPKVYTDGEMAQSENQWKKIQGHCFALI